MQICGQAEDAGHKRSTMREQLHHDGAHFAGRVGLGSGEGQASGFPTEGGCPARHATKILPGHPTRCDAVSVETSPSDISVPRMGAQGPSISSGPNLDTMTVATSSQMPSHAGTHVGNRMSNVRASEPLASRSRGGLSILSQSALDHVARPSRSTSTFNPKYGFGLILKTPTFRTTTCDIVNLKPDEQPKAGEEGEGKGGENCEPGENRPTPTTSEQEEARGSPGLAAVLADASGPAKNIGLIGLQWGEKQASKSLPPGLSLLPAPPPVPLPDLRTGALPQPRRRPVYMGSVGGSIHGDDDEEEGDEVVSDPSKHTQSQSPDAAVTEGAQQQGKRPAGSQVADLQPRSESLSQLSMPGEGSAGGGGGRAKRPAAEEDEAVDAEGVVATSGQGEEAVPQPKRQRPYEEDAAAAVPESRELPHKMPSDAKDDFDADADEAALGRTDSLPAGAGAAAAALNALSERPQPRLELTARATLEAGGPSSALLAARAASRQQQLALTGVRGRGPKICLVPGCDIDVTNSKVHCRRAQVCEQHIKASYLDFGDGIRLRFCQQCGKMQHLSLFDGNKRSCRKGLGHRRSKLKVAKAQSRSAAGAGGAGGAGDDDNDDDEEDGYEDDDDHYNAGESEEPLDEGRTVYVQGPTAASLLAATAQQQPAATAGQQQIRVITAGMLAGGQLQQAAQVAQHQAVSVMSPTMAQQVLRASGGGAGQALRAIETGSGGVIVLPSQAVLPSAAPSRQLIIGPGGAIIQQAAPQTIALSLAPAPGGGLRLTPTAAAASRSTVITAASATGALGGATILPGGLQLQLQQAQQPLQQQVVDINSLAAQLRSQGVVLASGSSTGQQQQGGTGLQLCQVGGSLYALPVSNNAGLSHALVAQVHAQAQAQAQAHVQSRQQQQEELLSLLLAQQAARSNKNG